MRKAWFAAALLLGAAGLLPADFRPIADQADRLHRQDRHPEAMKLLESSLAQAGSPAEQAELYWRIARAWLNLGDEAEDRKVGQGELLAFFEKGQQAARQAQAADPDNPLGYYWEAGNLGRWGQVKGILNALAKAKPMRDLLARAVRLDPGHADSWYVLGQLYEQVPGSPLSFGNKEWAVSLGRKAVDLQERQRAVGRLPERNLDFYVELAKHLYARNWDTTRRLKGQPAMQARYAAEKGALEKACFYEGTVPLEPVSDRQEALEMMRRAIGEMEALPGRTHRQEKDLKEARDLLRQWS